MTQGSTSGVYFLANDAIRDWAIAFLESYREFNPDLRLVLLPFDQRSDKLIALASKYRFEVYEDPSFAALEQLGQRINRGAVPYAPYWFRRFAAFWGPLDEFLYLDGRILVLSDVREMIRARQESGCDLLHYDCAIDQVYLPGEFRTKLVRERRVRGFLSGMFASRRGLFTLDELNAFADAAETVREHLNTRNADQCFLNFICDTKPVTYGSFPEVMVDVSANAWAQYRGVYRASDGFRHWEHGGVDHNRRVLLMHFAGKRIGPIMPYAWLFLQFRLRSEPWATRVGTRISWLVRYPWLKLADWVRRARSINLIYHWVRHRVLGHELPERYLALARERAKPPA
jgi:hypothetical protein